MRSNPERLWIYLGLGLVAGIGLAQLLKGPKIMPGQSRILLVGDSLAVGLGPFLKQLAKERNVAFEVLAKEGTRLDQWATSQMLRTKLAEFQPTLVLVSLGTNDEYLTGKDVVPKQTAAFDTLLGALMTVHPEAVVWIGPPTLPKPKSNGITAMLQAKTDHYFPSESLTIPRGPDQLHPTARGYAGWAGAIWQWLS